MCRCRPGQKQKESGRAGESREYWIVDIEAQTVVVYDFEHESLPKICGFAAPVPVGIWGGDCRIDFSSILARL